MRVAVQQEAQSKAQWVPLQAPVRGLMLNREAREEDPSGATVLENWFPTNRGVRVRGGLEHVATADGTVLSMFRYNHPTDGALFAATETDIANITGLNPAVVASNVVTGQTAGYYSSAQIGTTGDVFLYAVNGADSAQVFDGAAWQAVTDVSAPIAITGVDTSTFSQVWLFKNRLFFVQKDTATAWYLPVDSAGGAAQSLSLAGVFQRGGSLLFGATWSSDAGEQQDDRCVFVSTDGEVAIYEGTNPSDAATWRLAGRYDTARPMGINATMKAGGDLVIATVEGMIPLSQAVQKDPAALSLAAVTRNIEPIWVEQSRQATTSWEVLKWAERNIGLVSVPDAAGGQMFSVNLLTGAWSLQTGWAARCTVLHNEQAYIAVGEKVFAADETGSDDGAAFYAKYCGVFQDGGSAQIKRASMMLVTSYQSGEIGVNYSVAVDHNTQFPGLPNPVQNPGPDGVMVWGAGLWGEATWGAAQTLSTTATKVDKVSVSAVGYSFAAQIQIASLDTNPVDYELIDGSLSVEAGGVIV